MKSADLFTLLFQFVFAFLAGISFYLLAVAMTVYDGILSLIFQPIIGAIFSLAAIALLLILGLPIRLNRKLNRWWKKHWWISSVLLAGGVISMALSWAPAFRETVYDSFLKQNVENFNPLFAIGGWLLFLFAILHTYSPFPQQNENASS
jgi:hypothetical protein